MLNFLQDEKTKDLKTMNILLIMSVIGFIFCLITNRLRLSLIPFTIVILIVLRLLQTKPVDIYTIIKKKELNKNKVQNYTVFWQGIKQGTTTHIKKCGAGSEILINKKDIHYILNCNIKKNERTHVIILSCDEIKLDYNNYFLCLNYKDSPEDNLEICNYSFYEQREKTQRASINFIKELQVLNFASDKEEMSKIVSDDPELLNRRLSDSLSKNEVKNR